MPLQKKHGKGRLDKWYKLAKERGYRARYAALLSKSLSWRGDKNQVILESLNRRTSRGADRTGDTIIR